jgi:hypothetical protein
MKIEQMNKRSQQWNDIRGSLLRINPENNYKVSSLMAKLIGYLEAKEQTRNDVTATEILDEIYKMSNE